MLPIKDDNLQTRIEKSKKEKFYTLAWTVDHRRPGDIVREFIDKYIEKKEAEAK